MNSEAMKDALALIVFVVTLVSVACIGVHINGREEEMLRHTIKCIEEAPVNKFIWSEKEVK